MRYNDQATIQEAREQYFAQSGFNQTSYTEDWARIKLGPFTIIMPNFPMRKRALQLHDLHHIATGYETNIMGEAEVSAWEAASGGAGKYPVVWIYKAIAIFIGLFKNPRAIVKAYRRGLGCSNLFRAEFKEEFLSMTVGELRQSLGIKT